MENKSSLFRRSALAYMFAVALCPVNASAFNLSEFVGGLAGKEDDRKPQIKETDKQDNANVSGSAASGKRESQRIVIGFSPEGSAQNAVLGAINSASHNIRLMAYSFTSPVIVQALIKAKKRGVDIKVVVDAEGNTSKASIAAMNLLANASIPLRTISKYKIQHSKTMIIDNRTVETGSFNYSKSADNANSENVIVLYNYPEVAAVYITHWSSRWSEGKDWRSTY